MVFFDTISPQAANILLWIGGVAAALAIISFILSLHQQIQSFFKSFRKKEHIPSQPKLAISLVNGSRARLRANEVLYHPFDLGPNQALSFEQYPLVSFDWNLWWNFTLRITNQTEHIAYDVGICDFPHDEQYVTRHLTPPIDTTTPFKPHVTEEFEVVCNLNRRAKSEEADAIIKNYPFKALRIEYTNTAGEKFATVFSTVEADPEKKIQYFDLGQTK